MCALGGPEEPAPLTHAVLHHHEAALVALEALALEAARGVDAGAVAAQVGGDAALVDVWGQEQALGQDRPPPRGQFPILGQGWPFTPQEQEPDGAPGWFGLKSQGPSPVPGCSKSRAHPEMFRTPVGSPNPLNPPKAAG